MGVLPFVFKEGQNAASLGIKGDESFDIELPADVEPRQDITIKAIRPDGSSFEFQAMLRIDTAVELEYSRNGGILQTVIRKKLNEAKQPA